MSRENAIRVRWLAAVLLLALLVGYGAGQITWDRARQALSRSLVTDARLRASLLNSEIARFRLVPLTLSDDRDVVATLSGSAPATLNRKLEMLARTTGASVIYVVDRSGRAVAASNWRTSSSFVGSDYAFRRYVRDAQRFGAAAQFALGTVSGRPGLYLARRTTAGGVVVVKLEFDGVEADWSRAGGDTFVRDPHGVVLVSSRPAWRFALTQPLSPRLLATVRSEASLPPGSLRLLPSPLQEVTATVATAHPGWTLTLRKAVGATERAAARTVGIGAGLAVVALAALLWGLRQRSRSARRRTAELEDAVAARTALLTREMEERAAGEARAADLREGLRQANRLATLGQVTASVAHETAQPVAAIRTYAQTSAALLDRGDMDAVRANLSAIARLSDRIGTVTEELRGFARRRPGPKRPVTLAGVVDGAALILKEQLRRVTFDRPAIDAGLHVSGGHIRLEQVLVNVLQNALEALRDTPDPRIAMTLSVNGGHVVLAVTDNGPGVSAEVAARLFTPFVTSRADGLGLGLVIAHDIMTDIGGTLRHVAGASGARFEIEMVLA
ncbi:two-component system, NtrC family, C4-dicarboxylate transport sensor histidine kinase DctB [Sphingomonas gellani]|uniref:histidine kinase n=1 Tax=Sphingomonas gellani TaxID=1166340 RepID=A0A1H8CWW1_9SPHN|nr:ATP-binding protein [Sphingomonas gellani]SEM98934.1 two-component system, NtrC family, C4-dicarboxylate transport sensor histidine kinase DctB [Sphingomonas gellani]